MVTSPDDPGSRCARRRARRVQRGASLVEYLLLVGAVALIALAGVHLFGGTVDTKIRCLASRVASNGSACGSSSDGALTTSSSAISSGSSTATDGAKLSFVSAGSIQASPAKDGKTTRGEAARQALHSGTNATQTNDGTRGPEGGKTLSDPVPGLSVPEPEPPKWSPPDQGAGRHGSESPTIRSYSRKLAAEMGANAAAVSWPNASRNLLHFLGDTGKPLEQNVDQLLSDVPEFKNQIDMDQGMLGRTAVRKAIKLGASEPMTFAVDTPWRGFGYDYEGEPEYENQDWFHAMGGFQYSLTGQVTVYPPDAKNDLYHAEITTRVNIRDQYNWDEDKDAVVGPFTVSDKDLADLHRKGLAQEFTMYGASKPITKKFP